MIVEFCGVPGGGKSTLSNMYVKKYPQTTELVTIDMYKRLPELVYAGLFTIRHPLSFFWVLLFVVRFHMKGLFWYSLHLALRACAKYQKATFQKTSDIILVDEGLIHILCTLPVYSLTEEKIGFWIRHIVLPDVVCIAKSGTFHRFHRKDTSLHPRIKKGKDALNEWEEAVRANVLVVNECLQKMGMNVWDIPEQNSSLADLESLHLYLSNT